MATKKLKNTTGADKNWRGQTIANGAYYELTQVEEREWATDTGIHADITSGDLVVNDGTQDLDATFGLAYFKALDAQAIVASLIDSSGIGTGTYLTYTSAGDYQLFYEPLEDSVGDILDAGSAIHAHTHERSGDDEIDGDTIDIDYGPTNYTPDITPAEATHVDDLTAHLAGINTAIGTLTSTGGGFSDVWGYGDDSTVKNKFLVCGVNNHNSRGGTYLALYSGRVIHVSISTESVPETNWFVQIIEGAIKGLPGIHEGGTQIGTDLEKDAGVLDKIHYNLTGFTFSQGDRIAVYAKAGTLRGGDAVEPVVRLFVVYD
jgi:hypothetical protein